MTLEIGMHFLAKIKDGITVNWTISPRELQIMNVSPSGKYVKVKDSNAHQYDCWLTPEQIEIVEMLNPEPERSQHGQTDKT